MPDNQNTFLQEIYELWGYLFDALKMFGLFWLFLLLVLLIVAILYFIFSRHRFIKIFISYQKDDEEFARKLVQYLDNTTLKVLYIPIQERDHDELLDLVEKGMSKCDAMIAIPPLTRDSFVDSEIRMYSAARKPIVLLVDHMDRRHPDTAKRGHPVFIYDKLVEKDFEPLVTFFNYLFNHRNDMPDRFIRATAPIAEILVNIIGISFFMIAISKLFYMFEATQTFLDIFEALLLITGTVSVILIIVGVIIEMSKSKKATNVVRQKCASGEVTHNILDESIGYPHVMECISDAKLKTWHDEFVKKDY